MAGYADPMNQTLGCPMCAVLRVKWWVEDAIQGGLLVVFLGGAVLLGQAYAVEYLLTGSTDSNQWVDTGWFGLLMLVPASCVVVFFMGRGAVNRARWRLRHHLRYHARLPEEGVEPLLPAPNVPLHVLAHRVRARFGTRR